MSENSKEIDILNHSAGGRYSANGFSKQDPFPNFLIVDNFLNCKYAKFIAAMLEKEKFDLYQATVKDKTSAADLVVKKKITEVDRSTNLWAVQEKLSCYERLKGLSLIFGDSARNAISSVRGIDIPRTEKDSIMVTKWSEGCFVKPHTDHPIQTLIILSLARNWKSEFGGTLRFVEDNNVFDIVPKFNRAIIFQTRSSLTHEVLPVKIHRDAVRITLTISYYGNQNV